MADKVPVRTPDGRIVEGTPVEIESQNEHWNEYRLKDGTKIRMKLLVHQIVRLEERKPDGEPIYMIKSSNVLDSTVPDVLKVRGSN